MATVSSRRQTPSVRPYAPPATMLQGNQRCHNINIMYNFAAKFIDFSDILNNSADCRPKGGHTTRVDHQFRAISNVTTQMKFKC